MQQTSAIYKELLEAQQLGDPNVKFQTRLTIGEPGVLITKQGDSITFGAKAYTKTASGSTIVLTETEDRPLRGLKVFGRTTQNGNPTPDAPVPLDSVGDDGSVDVTVCGKNLLTNRIEVNGGTSRHGLTLTSNPDGSLHVVGTAKATANVGLFLEKPLYQGETVYIRCDGYKECRFSGYDNNGKYIYGTNAGAGGTYKIDNLEKSDYFKADRISIRVAAGETVDATVYLMVSQEPGAYEAPKEAQTLSITTSNGLTGIPVSSGGNYTDDSGQQWICDEVDFEKGQYIQRVRQVSVTRTTSSGNNLMVLENTAGSASPLNLLSSYTVSRNFGRSADGTSIFVRGVENAGNYKINLTSDELNALLAVKPMELIYQLETPIFRKLTEAEKADYAALHTNYPYTTVFNDSGAYTEIAYTMNGDGPTRILTGVSGADSGYDETLLISMETDARVFSEDTPDVGASISSQIDVEMIKPFAELPKQARLVPYVRLSDGLRHSEWIQKGVYYIDTRSKVEDGSSIEKIVLHGYDDMLKAEQDYPESTLSWPAKDLDVVREIAEFIGVAVDDRTVSIMNRGYTIQYPTGYSCRDVLGYIAAMYAGSFIMSDLGDLRLVTIYGIPKETRYLIEPNGYVITFGGDRILV